MKMKIMAIKKTVASSLVPESLSSVPNVSTFIKIKALGDNSQPIYIGDSDSQDFKLDAGEELPLDRILTASGGADSLDLMDIYCKVTVDGEGVAILIAKKP